MVKTLLVPHQRTVFVTKLALTAGHRSCGLPCSTLLQNERKIFVKRSFGSKYSHEMNLMQQ